jgi:hypothetical protein
MLVPIDAQTRLAMAIAPDYWLRWYSLKSLLLVGAVALLAYQLGRCSR